jgi:hypothetical protein
MIMIEHFSKWVELVALPPGIHENFNSASSCALYIYVHASFFG